MSQFVQAVTPIRSNQIKSDQIRGPSPAGSGAPCLQQLLESQVSNLWVGVIWHMSWTDWFRHFALGGLGTGTKTNGDAKSTSTYLVHNQVFHWSIHSPSSENRGLQWLRLRYVQMWAPKTVKLRLSKSSVCFGVLYFDSSEGFDKEIQLATLPLLLVQCRVILFPNSASDTLKLRLLVFQMSILIA